MGPPCHWPRGLCGSGDGALEVPDPGEGQRAQRGAGRRRWHRPRAKRVRVQWAGGRRAPVACPGRGVAVATAGLPQRGTRSTGEAWPWARRGRSAQATGAQWGAGQRSPAQGRGKARPRGNGAATGASGAQDGGSSGPVTGGEMRARFGSPETELRRRRAGARADVLGTDGALGASNESHTCPFSHLLPS